jgi:hypothetical protein
MSTPTPAIIKRLEVRDLRFEIRDGAFLFS